MKATAKNTAAASKLAAKHLATKVVDDVPELTEAQLRRFKRRDPGELLASRIADGFPTHSLEGVRKARNVTQVALANAAQMSQAEVSRLESRGSLEGVRIETLRRYVEALGGHLELVARFPSTGHLLGLGGAAIQVEEKDDAAPRGRRGLTRRRR